MKYLIFLAVATSIILSPVAQAQGQEEAVSIEKGDPAPFSGTLLTNEAAASLLAEIQICSERALIENNFELERQNATCDLEKSLLQIRIDSQKQMYENIINSQDQQLDYTLKVRNPKLSRELAFVIGVASGMVITTASVYAINAASN